MRAWCGPVGRWEHATYEPGATCREQAIQHAFRQGNTGALKPLAIITLVPSRPLPTPIDWPYLAALLYRGRYCLRLPVDLLRAWLPAVGSAADGGTGGGARVD